jgi:DNA modification methylase
VTDPLNGARFDIRQGDCLQLLAELPPRSIDAIVMDPPYCSGGFSETARRMAKSQGISAESYEKFGWFAADNMGTAGILFLLRAVGFHAVRLLHDGGSLITFCDWRQSANLGPGIESAGLKWQNLLVWNKGRAGLGNGFRAQHEMALHHVNGSAGIFHDATFGNVLDAKIVPSASRHHQTEKPVILLRRMIRVVAPPGGIVLDPFAGSSSTGVAALMEGRRYLGFDRDGGFVDVGRQRLEQTVASPLSSGRADNEQISLLDGTGQEPE